jgi:hypothetical protein
VPTRPGAMPVRRLPPRNGQPLPPRPRTPSRDAFVTRHQQGFTHVRPSSLPLTCGHQTARQPLGFPLSSTPPGTRYPGACQGGNRSPALTRATCPASAEPPSHNHSQRATSCRNRSQNRTPSAADPLSSLPLAPSHACLPCCRPRQEQCRAGVRRTGGGRRACRGSRVRPGSRQPGRALPSHDGERSAQLSRARIVPAS